MVEGEGSGGGPDLGESSGAGEAEPSLSVGYVGICRSTLRALCESRDGLTSEFDGAVALLSELDEDKRRKRRKGSGDLRPDEKNRERVDS